MAWPAVLSAGTQQHRPEVMTREQPQLGTAMLKVSQRLLGNWRVQHPRQASSMLLLVSKKSGSSTCAVPGLEGSRASGSQLGTVQFH